MEYLCEPELLYEPNDYNLAASQTNLDLINAKEAWDYVLGLPKEDIAITDTYFSFSHEDLDMNLVGGTNAYPSYVPHQKHGTLVAGCAGAISDNHIGISSIGFNTKLYVSSVWGSDNEVLRLAQLGYRIISCSWINSCSFNSIQEALYDEIRNVWGTVCVFGAGNTTSHCGSLSAIVYPAGYSSNIAVTSIGHINDYGTSGSPANNWKDVHNEIINDPTSSHHHNSTVDICAPGYNVKTTNVYGGYSGAWGTSFATPQVAATLGLLFSINPCLTANQAVNLLLDNTDNSIYNISENYPYLGKLGTGRLDAGASVIAAVEFSTTHIENQIFLGNQTIESNYAIQANGNVIIASGSDILFRARKEIIINGPFEVELNSTFNTDVNYNNKDCD